MKKIFTILLTAPFALLFSQSPRMSLYEEFTGETCGPCAATNPGLNAVLLSATNATRVIAIKWQVPIPSAPVAPWSLYLTNKSEIDWRYWPSGIGYGYVSQNTAATATSSGINSAPQGVLDGQHQWVFGAASDHPAYISDNVLATAQSYSSAFTIDMRHEWNNTKSAVIVTVNISASAPFVASGPLVFRCVMVERLIQFSVQPGTNGEKQFNDVAIRSYPSIQVGTPLPSSWFLGQSQNFVLNCPLPSYVRDVNQISMVGFIQDDGNRKVAQAARSRALYDAAALQASIGPVCDNTMTAIVSAENLGLNTINAFTVTPYVDGQPGPISTWSGTLVPGASASLALTPFAAPQASGPHTFSFVISAIDGVDFYEGNNAGTVSFPAFFWPPAFPVSEGFVQSGFPPAGWTLVNPDHGITWERSTDAGAYWQAPLESAKLNFFGNGNIGDVDQLYMPALQLSGKDQVELFFDYAYAQRNGSTNDRLEVALSVDCGKNWSTVFSKAGALLATAPSTPTAFLPDENDPTQWRTEQIPLPGFNTGMVLVKFSGVNDHGNNLYLDNINIVQHAPSGLSQFDKSDGRLTVSPNPASKEVRIQLAGAEEETSVRLQILDVCGSLVAEKEIQGKILKEGFVQDTGGLSEGCYFIRLAGTGGPTTKKLVICR